MASKIKYYAIIAALIIGAGVAGYFLRPIINPVEISVSNGVNNGGEEAAEKIKTNYVQADCMPYVLKYNDLAHRFDAFITAPPIVESAINGKIRFSILKNKYTLDYSVNDKPKLQAILGAGVNYSASAGLFYNASGGVKYDFIIAIASAYFISTAPFINGGGVSLLLCF